MLCETLPRLEADEYPGGLWYYEKANAKCQVYLNVLLSRSLFYAKIVQGECKTSSLLESFAEPQPILCK